MPELVKIAARFFLDLIERKPQVGYLGAVVPTGAGLVAFLPLVTALLGLVSISIGIAVGLVTYRVQRKTERLRDLELRRAQKRP